MIAQSITAALAAMRASVSAARPINEAPPSQLAALVQQGAALLTALDAQIATTGRRLDGFDLSGPIETLAERVTSVVVEGEDHRLLHDLRGYAGRAVFNIAQGSA